MRKSGCALALLLVLGAAGCGQNDRLDADTAAPLILQAKLAECRNGSSLFVQSVDAEGPPSSTPSLGARGLSWLETLRRDQSIRLVSRAKGSFSYGVQELFAFKDNGAEYAISVFSENDDIRKEVIIKMCPYLPAAVEILDISQEANAKTAHVTYRLKWKQTDPAEFITNIGLGTFTVPAPEEYTATLRRLDATGWRFENDGDGSLT